MKQSSVCLQGRKKKHVRELRASERYRNKRNECFRKIEARKRALLTDDPYTASVLNSVDHDKLTSNANNIVHAQRLAALPRISWSDAEAIHERIGFYFQLCVTDGIRPNLPGLALALGTTRSGLMNAMTDRRMTRDAADEIGRGLAMLDEIISSLALDGKINPVAVIYFMNNWLG